MWKTALTAFVSAIIGGLIVFYSMPVDIGQKENLTKSVPSAAKTENTPGNQNRATGIVSQEMIDADNGYPASEIYRQFGPGVVHIKSTFTRERTDFFGFRLPPEQQQAGGSGFIIDKTGIIVTNAHVVQDSNTLASAISVVLSDSEEVKAKLLGTDPSTDIAVLKIDPGKRSLKVLKLGNSAKLKVGDTVYAIGSPFELEGTMTEGIVSALDRTIESPNPNFMIRGAIQTDAAVNPGNSGGPLINSYGEVIGINSQIASSSGSFAGIAFAIPSNTVKTIAQQIEKTGRAQHAWLGISGGIELNDDIASLLKLSVTKGVMVARVYLGSPAANAGIIGAKQILQIETGERIMTGGDIIMKIDDKNVFSIEDILGYIESRQVGNSVKIQINRDGKTKTITAKLGERPQDFGAE
jgi:S1-C subfamily serine protease